MKSWELVKAQKKLCKIYYKSKAICFGKNKTALKITKKITKYSLFVFFKKSLLAEFELSKHKIIKYIKVRRA